ncbi:hypothetical protein BD324DRAFT_251630 [Kockovaella imperatae]|uniref:DUF885 domain-containing protein n=1 Tax=Kockovaella imperatae TaxID=4999 RepID=A0A1Y1UPR0_9TREE|nr:hypothetical protein BD324DRAFT_251630 [Kockovaella imperatae]ORX40040.1 hypothetical protein BD324DRAFT_251630 [Kockovaella imperatae]
MGSALSRPAIQLKVSDEEKQVDGNDDGAPRQMTWTQWLFGSGAFPNQHSSPTPTSFTTTSSSSSHRSHADDEFKSIYTKEWHWRQEEHLEAGEDDHDAVEPWLPVVDPETQQRRLTYWKGILHSLDKIEPSRLSREERVNYGVYKYQIETFVDQIVYKEYEKPLNGDTAFWSNQAYVARMDFTHRGDYDNYLLQMDQLPRYFDQQIDNMRAGLKRGFTAPKITLEGRDATILSVTGATGQDNLYYTPFKKMPSSISAKDQEMLRNNALSKIEHIVLPTYHKLLTYFQNEYYPNAREDLAAEDLPNGKAYYQSKIKEFTTTTLTPKEIHQIGLQEIDRINKEMQQVIKDANFHGTFDEFLDFLRKDPQFYAKTPDDLLKDAAWIAKEFDGVASKFFGRLPRERFAIIPVPPDVAPFYTSGRGGPGVYLVNTYDLPSRALYSLPALTLHESAPGHCFQMSLVKEHELPHFRSAYISAYGEGWALYCEHLGSEMGIYHTPYQVFGMLSYQAWRAARLVVDTGVHAMGWTREQAQDYVKNNTALSAHEVETEVDRYISWPGQALAYYLGMLEIKQARAHAEEKLGDKFDIRAFHDALLQTGSIPLPLLKEYMARWVKDGGKSPYEV